MQSIARSMRLGVPDSGPMPQLSWEQLADDLELSLFRWLGALWGAGGPGAPPASKPGAAEGDAADADAQAHRVGASGEPPMILIVEDDPINRRVLRRLLSRLGYACEMAENGQEALDRLRDVAFDGVLMDIRMPVMDGIVAIKTIRKLPDPKVAQLPIIAVTAQVLESNRETCLNMGFNDYLPKPVNRASLAESLQRFVPRRP